MRDKDWKKASEVVNFLEDLIGDKARDAGKFHNLFQSWEELVRSYPLRRIQGRIQNRNFPKMAAHSKIKDLKGGTLIIDVDHSGWMQVFEFERKPFREYLQKRFPQVEIHTIRLRLVSDLHNPPPIEEVKFTEESFAPTGKIEVEKGESAYENLKDEGFKGLLGKLGKAIEEKDQS